MRPFERTVNPLCDFFGAKSVLFLTHDPLFLSVCQKSPLVGWDSGTYVRIAWLWAVLGKNSGTTVRLIQTVASRSAIEQHKTPPLAGSRTKGGDDLAFAYADSFSCPASYARPASLRRIWSRCSRHAPNEAASIRRPKRNRGGRPLRKWPNARGTAARRRNGSRTARRGGRPGSPAPAGW